ncbi:MAG TPA: hypothetical protein VMH81_16350 [Bryobacteraceae bacterium]|nr:hypothetical protein [Bryobacteraceae bacterium]
MIPSACPAWLAVSPPATAARLTPDARIALRKARPWRRQRRRVTCLGAVAIPQRAVPNLAASRGELRLPEFS